MWQKTVIRGASFWCRVISLIQTCLDFKLKRCIISQHTFILVIQVQSAQKRYVVFGAGPDSKDIHRWMESENILWFFPIISRNLLEENLVKLKSPHPLPFQGQDGIWILRSSWIDLSLVINPLGLRNLASFSLCSIFCS